MQYSTYRLHLFRTALWIAFLPGVVYLWLTSPQMLWVVLGVYCVQQCIGFNAYMHRFVSHRSYKTYKPVEVIMAAMSVPLAMGTPLSWAWMHRVHHRYTETPKDPHCHRHMGYWRALFCLKDMDMRDRRVGMKDVANDKIMVWIHKYYFPLNLAYAAIILVLGGVDWLLAIFLIPAAMHSFLVGYCLSIMAHQWGYQNYPDKDNSKNSWLCNILTVGDGWHNNHHTFPGQWNFQHKWWELDPTAMFIRLIKK